MNLNLIPFEFVILCVCVNGKREKRKHTVIIIKKNQKKKNQNLTR